MAHKIKLKISPRLLKKNKKSNVNIVRKCRFCSDKEMAEGLDYKNSSLLKSFLTESGKIIASRVSGNCSPCQRKIEGEIKKARIMALIPFCSH